MKFYVCMVLLYLLGLTFMSKKIICCDKCTLIVLCLVTYKSKIYMCILIKIINLSVTSLSVCVTKNLN